MQIKLTRKELYDLVWEKPLSSLMTKYTISYLEVKELLKKHNIPCPPNGYWSRLKAGYQISSSPLPDDLNGGDMILYDPKVINKRTKKVKLTPMEPVKVESIGNLEKEVLQAQEIFKQEAKGRPSNQLMPIGYESLMINVSRSAIDRSLYFMDKLIKEVKRNHGEIRVIPRSTFIQIDGEEFYIALREKQKRIENIDAKHSFERYQKVGSGVLIFKIGEQPWRAKEWSDTAYTIIENKIEEIIQYLRSAAQIEKQERAARELRAIEQAKEKQIELDFDKRRAAELAKFVQLKQQSELWENAQRMRRYLTEIERVAKHKAENNEALQDYITWAENKIAWYDPLISKQDELLNDIDKHTLVIPKKGYW